MTMMRRRRKRRIVLQFLECPPGHSSPSSLFSKLYSCVRFTFQPSIMSSTSPITLQPTCSPKYLSVAAREKESINETFGEIASSSGSDGGVTCSSGCCCHSNGSQTSFRKRNSTRCTTHQWPGRRAPEPAARLGGTHTEQVHVPEAVSVATRGQRSKDSGTTINRQGDQMCKSDIYVRTSDCKEQKLVVEQTYAKYSIVILYQTDRVLY